MGLFNKKEKPKDYVRLIKELGVDFYGYTHEGLNPSEISIDDELNGVIKKSHGELNDNSDFNFISLSDKKDGFRNIFLMRENSSEKDLRDVINKFSTICGQDSVWQKEFSQRDLNIIRGYDSDHDSDDHIRKWETYYKNGMPQLPRDSNRVCKCINPVA